MSTFEFVEVGLPASDDKEEWKKFWISYKQPWRTEPRISKERQEYLAERRKIEPDPIKHIYPFRNIKLSRADIEWLLSTHHNNRGPVDWYDESQREREGLDLRGADLCGENLQGLPLARIIAGPPAKILYSSDLMDEREKAVTIRLDGANLNYAHLEGAELTDTHLEEAKLIGTHLEGAALCYANLKEAVLFCAHLEGADLSDVFFDNATNMQGIYLSNNKYGTAFLCDVCWEDVNVAVIDWSKISRLGEESDFDYERAARAYRQLTVALRNQGLNEQASRFTYRAQLMQRKVYWDQRKFLQYLGSLFLDLLSGYGYKPLRCFIAYLIAIASFAVAYFIIGLKVGPELSPVGSVVFSMTSFHGRGFFPGGIKLDDPLTVLAALEAFIGLLIEVTFIATLTRRLFGQ